MGKSKPSTGGKQGYSACRDPATGRFVKGNKSGGRPRLPEELKADFRAAAPRALEVLLDILNDDEAAARDRIRAAEIILDRGYGKPAQAVELSTDAQEAAGVILIPTVSNHTAEDGKSGSGPKNGPTEGVPWA